MANRYLVSSGQLNLLKYHFNVAVQNRMDIENKFHNLINEILTLQNVGCSNNIFSDDIEKALTLRIFQGE